VSCPALAFTLAPLPKTSPPSNRCDTVAAEDIKAIGMWVPWILWANAEHDCLVKIEQSGLLKIEP
jgi:hypothetical protein